VREATRSAPGGELVGGKGFINSSIEERSKSMTIENLQITALASERQPYSWKGLK